MRCIAKERVINRYKPKVNKTIYEIDSKGKRKEKVIIVDNLYCEKNEDLILITKNAGPHSVAVTCENKKGERFTIMYDNILIIDENAEFNFDD